VHEELPNDVEQVVAILFELSKTEFEATAGLHRTRAREYELVHGDPEGRREPLRKPRAEASVVVDDPADALPADARELREPVVVEPGLLDQPGQMVPLGLLPDGLSGRMAWRDASQVRSARRGPLAPRGGLLVARLGSCHYPNATGSADTGASTHGRFRGEATRWIRNAG
jgi:hypothetical protein